jgi:hypothetical protein
MGGLLLLILIPVCLVVAGVVVFVAVFALVQFGLIPVPIGELRFAVFVLAFKALAFTFVYVTFRAMGRIEGKIWPGVSREDTPAMPLSEARTFINFSESVTWGELLPTELLWPMSDISLGDLVAFERSSAGFVRMSVVPAAVVADAGPVFRVCESTTPGQVALRPGAEKGHRE